MYLGHVRMVKDATTGAASSYKKGRNTITRDTQGIKGTGRYSCWNPKIVEHAQRRGVKSILLREFDGHIADRDEMQETRPWY
jgi:hypothetical protein